MNTRFASQRTLVSALLTFALGLPLGAAAQPRFELASTPTRLPKTVLPQRVQLRLDVDPARDDFGGKAAITLRVVAPVSAIVLHARDLKAQRIALRGPGRTVRVLDAAIDEAASTWRLVPRDGRPIASGAYRLEIAYRGAVRTSGEGLFRVDYREQDQPARMLVTQLEAVDARRLLPCFDEPVFRAAFELSVRAPAEFEVVSNMPRRAVHADGSARRHVFAASPSMPGYLLALAVGRFDALEGRASGVPLRILTPRGRRDQARHAMVVTQQVMPYYARYFGRRYALPKLDQLAVPGTLVGAMENWGLITYVEPTVLFDPAHSGPDGLRRVFSVVAHEVAHQWFGNLVSAASWSEIWLNEAFATWMERKAQALFHPEWQSALRFRRDLEWTIDRDATAATRAIRSGPVSEGSVFEVFDGITYMKGGAVLSMLEQWIGPEAFQRGLASYMAERAMKPATAGDLWHHIGRAAGQPVAAVAASWTDQPGVPLLEVASRCDEAQRTVVTLRQGRFSLGDPLPGGPWLIPLRLARGGEAIALLMREREQQIVLPGCDARPLLANAGGVGYLRVDHDAALRAPLADAFASLPAADRVALLSDSFALASAGRRPMADHLALLRSLPAARDASRTVLYAMALQQWRQLDAALDGSAAQAPLRAAGRALFAPALAQLGWTPAKGEDNETQLHRSELIVELARLDHAPTIAQARERFASVLGADSAAAPSLRRAVLVAVGSQASDAEFDALLAALRTTDRHEDRYIYLDALAAGRDVSHAQRLLDESLSGRLPPDIAADIPGKVGERPSLAPMTYAFVLAHWPALAKLAGDGPFGGQYWLLPGAAYWSADAEQARRLLADQQRLAGAAGASTADRVVAGIELRRRLREREVTALPPALAAWRVPP